MKKVSLNQYTVVPTMKSFMIDWLPGKNIQSFKELWSNGLIVQHFQTTIRNQGTRTGLHGLKNSKSTCILSKV